MRCLIKPLLIFVLCFNSSFVFSQEICDNGKDDDGDGLIDLQDPDCSCKWEAATNLLLNPSFEDYKHCLTTNGAYIDNYDIANYWLYGVQPNGDISFYRNLSCPSDSLWAIPNFVARPIPDGSAFLMMIRGVTGDFTIPEKETQKYYVAQCLQTPLIKNRDYTFSFYGAAYLNKTIEKFAVDSFTIAVFGNKDCSAVPFGTLHQNNGCPANYPGWIMLGKATFVSPYTWVQAKMKLTIPEDINVIEIGADCSVVYWGDTTRGGNSASKPYYNLDNFQLAETKDFNFQYITIQSGDACNGGYVLKAPASANATYQWYRDSIALVGRTDSILYINEPSVTANYNVRITKAGRCQISEPVLVKRSMLQQVKFPSDTVSCNGDTLKIGKRLPGVVYKWNGLQDTIVRLTQSGNYTITASDDLGCTKDFTVKTEFKDCIGCKIFVPNAFTPNDDGLNDVLKTHSSCPIEDYQLQIFNRWGQKVFETKNLSKGWDGNFNGKRQPNGVYIYFVRYKNSVGEKNYKLAKGTVVIIR